MTDVTKNQGLFVPPNAAAWKQPEAKLPQMVILALVLFARDHLANNFPPLFLDLCVSLTQLNSVCRGRVLMAHVKCPVLKEARLILQLLYDKYLTKC